MHIRKSKITFYDVIHIKLYLCSVKLSVSINAYYISIGAVQLIVLIIRVNVISTSSIIIQS